MDVILLQRVENLGDLGDQVKVRSGYGRNYLLPSGRATLATPENIKQFEERRAELEKQAQQAQQTAEGRRDKLDGLEVTLVVKAGEEGKLFGSIGAADIADAASQKAGVEVAKKEVRMPEGTIRSTGEYEVELHLHTGVDATIKLHVTAE